MLIYVVSSFFFRKLLFGEQYLEKIREKIRSEKNEVWVVCGREGRWINETGSNVLPFLNVSLHCFDEQN